MRRAPENTQRARTYVARAVHPWRKVQYGSDPQYEDVCILILNPSTDHVPGQIGTRYNTLELYVHLPTQG